ncbi:MAG: Na+/H+ antiporter NhaA [Acidimicrobiales bacterium]
MSIEPPIRKTWSASDRFVPRTVVRPIQRFFVHEAAGGMVMLLAALVAIVWANSPFSDSYTDLWTTPLSVELGHLLHVDLSLQGWVNDAAMTVFFLLVGIEIKREIVHGNLRDIRAVTLPIIAAFGGMVVPALVFVAFTNGEPGSNGWGIPMATDIAFAVGVVSLLGKRVPLPAKIFLLTLAVADDIGAILVIAVFYTTDLSFGWLLVALGSIGIAAIMRRGDVQALAPYLAVGTVAWFALHESGVHATLVGVALGLMVPAWPLRSPMRYPDEVRGIVTPMDEHLANHELTQDEFEENEEHIAEVIRLSQHSTSPLGRLERALTPWVAYVIVPTFALANAGVQLSGDALGGLASDPVTLGVGLGLLVGKTVGISAAAYLAIKLGVARLPAGTTFRHIVGLAMVAGIGFTVALFVTSISLTEPALIDSAKVGILAGSLIAGVAGYLMLRAIPAGHDDDTALGHEQAEPVPQPV